MNEFLQNVGLVSILCVVMFAVKVHYDRAYLRRVGRYEDEEE
ncbi:hypothetical protein [Paenibacillus tepidiphilus]|nr:hypothetical protein [Paenibacillus tepidiphilus]